MSKLDTADGVGTRSTTNTVRPERFRVIVDLHLILRKNNDILLGRRANTGYADGAYHPPAGHLEKGESVVDGLIREAEEEIGVTINAKDVELAHVMHNASGEGRIAFFFEVGQWGGQIENREPHKCSELKWFPLDGLPEEMIGYAQDALLHYVKGEFFSTYEWV